MILLSAFRGEGGASGNLLLTRFLRIEGAGFSLPPALPRMRHSRGGVNEANSSFHLVVFDRVVFDRIDSEVRECGSDSDCRGIAGRIAESAAETAAGSGHRDAH